MDQEGICLGAARARAADASAGVGSMWACELAEEALTPTGLSVALVGEGESVGEVRG